MAINVIAYETAPHVLGRFLVRALCQFNASDLFGKVSGIPVSGARQCVARIASLGPETVYIQDTGSTNAAATPGTPTLGTAGTAGTTDRWYQIVAHVNNGVTLPGPVAELTTGNATPSATNYDTISWSQVVGADSYDVLVSSTSATTGFELLANVTGLSATNTGQTLTAYTIPTVNTGVVPYLNGINLKLQNPQLPIDIARSAATTSGLQFWLELEYS